VPAERVQCRRVAVGAPTEAFSITKWSKNQKAAEAPSNLSITGAYISACRDFRIPRRQATGAAGESSQTDPMVRWREQPF